MHWNDFLTANNAHFVDDEVTDFGQVENETNQAINGNIMSNLSHLSIIEVTGQDAEDFLHGQFTNDLKTLSSEKLQINTWCNAKGQVFANFIIFRTNSDFVLLLPSALKTQFIKRLQMFILRADVNIKDRSNELIRIGLSGNSVSEQLNDIIADIPKQAGNIVSTDQYTCLHIADSKPRYILIGTVDVIKKAWQQFAVHITPVGTQCWRLLDIFSGFPWIDGISTEQFLPQLLNLDKLDGVSFDKGCYPGQEIIARLNYRGQVKRRLYLASVKSETLPMAGDDLYQNETGQRVGKIINIQAHPEFTYILLAVIDMESVGSNNISLKGSTETTFSFHPLPYLPDA